MALADDFGDPAGDAGSSAPDIVAVSLSNDGGSIVAGLSFANRARLLSGARVSILIDGDSNPQTGCETVGPLGVDYRFEVDGDTGSTNLAARLMRCSEGRFSRHPTARVEAGSSPEDGGVWLIGNVCDIGNPRSFQWIVATALAPPPGTSGYADLAPDAGLRRFEAPPASCAPPSVTALASRGTVGRTTALRLRLTSLAFEVTLDIRVLRRQRLVARFTRGALTRRVTELVTPSWKPPARARGRLRFCVRARELDGGQQVGRWSKPSCAPLVISAESKSAPYPVGVQTGEAA